MVQKSESFSGILSKPMLTVKRPSDFSGAAPAMKSLPSIQLDTIVDTFVCDDELMAAVSGERDRGLLSRLAKVPGAGILLATLSGVFFATGSLIVKLISEIHAMEIVVIRSIIQALVYALVIAASGLNPLGVPNERFALFLRCLNGFVSVSCAYLAFHKIPLGDATSIIFSSPIFVTVIACFLLHEPCGPFQCFTLALGLTGIALICKPSFLFGDGGQPMTDDRLVGTVLALLASLTAALVFISMRKLRKTPSSVSIFCFSMFSILAGSAVLAGLREFQLPSSARVWWLLLANGLCGTCGQLLLTFSLKIENAGPISLARTIDIVMAFVYQIFVLDQTTKLSSLLGAAIICCGVILLALYKWYQQRPDMFDRLFSAKRWYARCRGRPAAGPAGTPAVSVDTASTRSSDQAP